jgi:hypothetical protein
MSGHNFIIFEGLIGVQQGVKALHDEARAPLTMKRVGLMDQALSDWGYLKGRRDQVGVKRLKQLRWSL